MRPPLPRSFGAAGATLLLLVLAVLLGSGLAPRERGRGSAIAAPPAAAPILYAEARGDPDRLAERLGELPVKIRFAGSGWALVEVGEPDLSAVAEEFPALRVLRRAAAPLRLFALAESELTVSGRAECDPHTLLRIPEEDLRIVALPGSEGKAARAGGRLLPLAEHVGGAHALPLPASMSARALAPLPAAERASPYRQSRLGDPEARRRATALAAQVDSARLVRVVRELSTGPGATRHSCRDEVTSFAGRYLLDTLQSIFSAPGDQVFAHYFGMPCGSSEVDLFNVIARRPGRRPGSGRYILSAHYDTIGRNTPGWDHETDPAPGADDNASGVACVIEAARALLEDSYDFDLEVALFSGEEQGLIGSRAYAADPVAEVEEVLGVINLDMVGYNPRAADSLNAVANFTSEWLADLIVEAEAALPADRGLRWFDKVVQAFGRSDHAAFWEHGESGILLIENIDIERHNPNYHRVTDTLEALTAVEGADLMRRATEVVVMALGQFAFPAPEPGPSFRVTPAGILLYRPDGRILVQAVAGQDVEVRTRVINEGAGAEGAVQAEAVLRLDGRVIARGRTSFDGWGNGVWQEIVVPWSPTSGHIGSHELRVDLALHHEGETTAAGAGVGIEVIALIRDASIAPNPVRPPASLATASLRLLLNDESELRCRVLDALGTQVGEYANRVSLNQRIPLEQIVGAGPLPSGVYVLLLELRGPGQRASVDTRKLTFAYMR